MRKFHSAQMLQWPVDDGYAVRKLAPKQVMSTVKKLELDVSGTIGLWQSGFSKCPWGKLARPRGHV